MMNSARHVVEILFQGISREIKLPAPVTVVGLREAIVSTFDIAKIMSAENSGERPRGESLMWSGCIRNCSE